MENECDEMTESDFRRWVVRNFCELKEHVLTKCKETKNLEKRFDEMLTRMDKIERNISELMELKNATRELREACTSIKSRMDQAEERTVDRIVGLELGADDYVQKPCPPRELVARINAILRRSANARAVAAPVVAGPVTIDPAQHLVQTASGPISLTGTEFALFELLARHIGRPVPKEEIYPKVLGRPMGPYDRAIDVHVSAIRHKIAPVVGKQIAIESIRGVGYQLVVRPED